jgi:hypothetical protein
MRNFFGVMEPLHQTGGGGIGPDVTFGIGAGLQGIGAIYSAKKQADASKYSARLQTEAAKQASLLQDAAAKRSLGFTQHQSFLDQVRANAAAKAQYGADVAGSQNAYNMAGDSAFNQRAEFNSLGQTNSKVRGQRTNQMNYLRDLLGYGQPQESLDTFVAPDALRQAGLIIPKEMEYTDPVDDSIDPETGKPRPV